MVHGCHRREVGKREQGVMPSFSISVPTVRNLGQTSFPTLPRGLFWMVSHRRKKKCSALLFVKTPLVFWLKIPYKIWDTQI
jgi:hypothetical protein